MYWKKRIAYRVLVGAPEGKGLLRRHSRRRKKIPNKIKTILIGLQRVDCTNLVQNRDRCNAIVIAAINFRIQQMHGVS
jgi:hypothetical protein